ncbi:MAG: GNAT family N-acetyltransferase [Xanthomonadaceae bacterium]|nr:GNAT family N-acetyltransferase [Xanthomonadaceae bacterium]
MIDGSFFLEPARWETGQADLKAVRMAVFVLEQAIPESDEWDALDARSQHLLARDATGRAIGCGRLTPDRTIGRMAVLRDWRGHGVGAALLRSLIEQARASGWPEAVLHAQVQAMPFYAQQGFAPFGDVYDECGIPHQRMRLILTAPEPPPMQRGVTTARPAARLLETSSRDEIIAAVLALLGDARHTMAFYTRELDPGLLDADPVLEALRELALRGRGAELRLLVQEPLGALREGHRLIALAQRLPSVIRLRVPIEDNDRQYAAACALNDVGGYLLRPLGNRYEGQGNTCDPGRQAQLLRYFEQVWERSQPAAVLRPLEL